MLARRIWRTVTTWVLYEAGYFPTFKSIFSKNEELFQKLLLSECQKDISKLFRWLLHLQLIIRFYLDRPPAVHLQRVVLQLPDRTQWCVNSCPSWWCPQRAFQTYSILCIEIWHHQLAKIITVKHFCQRLGQTADLWFRKQSLCQLNHNQWQSEIIYINRM